VERQNSIELAERIKFIIENPDLAKQMGKKARNQFLQSLTLEVFENNLVNILNQI
jgi:glycosyltransferase involved in cell wall biosynthesis